MKIIKRLISFFLLLLLTLLIFYTIGVLLNQLIGSDINDYHISFEHFLNGYKELPVLLITVAGTLLSGIFYIYFGIKFKWFNPSKYVQKYQRADSDAYGNARLMTDKEMVKLFGDGKGHYYNYPSNLAPKSGWVVKSKIENKKYDYLMFTRDTNMCTIGSPGVGKTQYYLMPNIILNSLTNEKPTMIINDVKGELFNSLSKKLEENGYKIYNLNLRNERSSSRFNPLELMWNFFQEYTHKFNLILNDNNDVILKKENILLGDSEKVIFDNLAIKFEKEENNIDIKTKNNITISSKENYYFSLVDILVSETTKYYKKITIPNENSKLNIYRKNENNEFEKIKSITIFKDSALIDKVTTEILSLSSTIIPEGSGENQTWNSGSRGIIEGCIWGMLEDSLNPKYKMSLQRFTINNIGNIINKSSSQQLQSWLKARDKKVSRSLTAAAMIVDNDSEKTVASYISNTNTLLKEYLTSGISYITSASDFELKDIVAGKEPVALFITIPDENSTKYPIATLFIKQIYNFMIYYASDKKIDHLERKAYFYLDEFAQMPKIKEFKQWTGACRSRWIYFNIILQSVSQLYSIYGKEEGSSILSNCAIHLYLGSSDSETVKYFHEELGKETIVTRSSSASETTMKKAELNANYSMTSREIVPINQLTKMEDGIAYFKIFRHNPCKTTYIPYFSPFAQKIGLFKKGSSVNATFEESIYNERDSYYDIIETASIYEKANNKMPEQNVISDNKTSLETSIMTDISRNKRTNLASSLKSKPNLKYSQIQDMGYEQQKKLLENYASNITALEKAANEDHLKLHASFPRTNKERNTKEYNNLHMPPNIILEEVFNNFAEKKED